MKFKYIDKARATANACYGGNVDPIIKERLNREIEAFDKLEGIDDALDYMRDMLLKGEELYLPRLTLGNSLFLFLIGLNNINPLPRHHYCPHCHAFHWGEKPANLCSCGTPYREEGFDLDFDLLEFDMKSKGFHLNYATGDTLLEKGLLRLKSDDNLSLAKCFGITEADLWEPPERIAETVEELRDFHRAKKDGQEPEGRAKGRLAYWIKLFNLSRFGELLEHYDVKTLEELAGVICMTHGVDVAEANEKYIDATGKSYIASRDELFTLLSGFDGIGKEGACAIIRDIDRRGGGLSPEMERRLIDSGANSAMIGFLKRIAYIFPKAHSVCETIVYLRIAAEERATLDKSEDTL